MKNKTEIKIVQMQTSQLIAYENNPRHNDRAVDAVAASIKTFGWKQPLVIDKDGVIVAGHTRHKAAQRLGLDTCPCIIADDLTDDEIRAYRLADNKVAELAEWDFEKLEVEMEELAEVDFDMTAFGFDELEEEMDEPQEITEDEPPEVDEESEPRCQLGDIWQLGRHRLMCGDSTDPLNIKLLMQGRKADLVFTDPPYGMKKEADGVANDNLNYDDLLEFNKQWIPITFDALKENGSWYCWGIDEPLMDIYSHILKPMQRANKITFRNLITWDKGTGIGQRSELARMYVTADEKCLFVMCGVQGFNNNADHYDDTFEPIRAYMEQEAKKVGLTSKMLAEITGVQMYGHWFTKSQFCIIPETHYIKLQEYFDGAAFAIQYNDLKSLFDCDKHKTLKEAIMAKRAYFDNVHDNMNNVWHFARTAGEEREGAGGHATPKPLALCARAIKSSSREGEIVLDVFGGSGSTLITCEQLNRSARLIELEPKWCDVIIRRWEQLTGEKAELVKV